MMQKTHPDKSPDYSEQFHLMRECHEMLKGGIPEPVPTHTATNLKQKNKQIERA